MVIQEIELDPGVDIGRTCTKIRYGINQPTEQFATKWCYEVRQSKRKLKSQKV